MFLSSLINAKVNLIAGMAIGAGLAMICMLLFAFHYSFSTGTDKLVVENRRLENMYIRYSVSVLSVVFKKCKE